MSDQGRGWLQGARAKWTNIGRARPDFAVEPAPGEESVWDYPRPPVVVADERRVVVAAGDDDTPLAATRSALRVLETASPPTFYLPASDIDRDRLEVVDGSSMCEWKGRARYWAMAGDPTPVAWDYPEPFPEFAVLLDHLAFYPGRVRCTVGDEEVRAQPGGFYGGWITDEVIGPFKGEPGTEGW